MPKGGAKAKLKKKAKAQQKSGGKAAAKDTAVAAAVVEDNEEEKQMDVKGGGSTALLLSKRALLDKYDIVLGPKGYVPAPPGTPKSIHIEEFSMVDPGGGRELLTKTEINIKENSIYGLVGKNGFGKTTLLKQMYNYEIEGFPKHIRMILVNQEELISDDNILRSVLQADEIRERLIKTEDRLTLMLEQVEDEKSQEEINQILEMIWGMHEDLNYDQSEKRAMQILTGLGFNKQMMESKKVSDLSGGWQTRVKLARALFVEPDLMLLDEPTNHLDFPTVLWLQKYLESYEKTVIVVSHDRAFLNGVCNWTIHLTQMKLLYFRGNYDTMMKTSQFSLVEQVKGYEAKLKEITQIKEWIQKYGGKGEKMAAAVKSKKKVLDDLESDAELLEPARKDKTLKFEFPDVGKLEQAICVMEGVDFKYPNMDSMLLSHVDMILDCDSRIGMLGANGVGKSTLVKLMLAKLEPLKGECKINRQARVALFTQYHMDQLNLEQSAVEFLMARFADDPEMQENKDKVGYSRRRLGRFKLTGKQHTQKMKFLSGGQKSRVAFCVATWSKPHFLIMDEPTNHLDMETIDSLVEAIESFPGGCLVISHDQYFLEKAASEYWAVTPETIKAFHHFENAKNFAMKSRMDQIKALDEDEDESKSKEDFEKKKAAKKKDKKPDKKSKK
eukprot:CAMPEP_0202693648 /NCGR_PEP_ID=MMETSP1385-20130828/7689_1 /ASSEMBLY_ACC=CAM_ASM_000861 /TAXON_ID=933848 /ORGANISM="Elphidium margaritaceum" /LENGTH=669 /DNA_ID=CAMNT_0049349351 /DNA_START=62 /DNA_END=2071 /DNA_ORIENTATION=+